MMLFTKLVLSVRPGSRQSCGEYSVMNQWLNFMQGGVMPPGIRRGYPLPGLLGRGKYGNLLSLLVKCMFTSIVDMSVLSLG